MERTLLLAYPSGKLLERFGCAGAEQLDREHYLIMAVLDRKGRAEKLTLVNFQELGEPLRDLLERNGGVVYMDG